MIDIATLFRLHQKDVQGFLRKKGVSPELAADLTQEAFRSDSNGKFHRRIRAS